MKAYFDFLREVRERPAMFVGTAATLVETMRRIEMVLLGFEMREDFEEGMVSTQWNLQFREFVATKEKLSPARVIGVVAALEQRCVVPMTIWNDYFDLVDEFEAKWPATSSC